MREPEDAAKAPTLNIGIIAASASCEQRVLIYNSPLGHLSLCSESEIYRQKIHSWLGGGATEGPDLTEG